MGSINGESLDLIQIPVAVKGLPAGGQVIIKPRTNCASGCQDFVYWYQEPVSVFVGTEVTGTFYNV